MGWWNRIKEGVTTSTKEKKEAPDGLWKHCNGCNQTIHAKELKENMGVCPKCDHHFRISSDEYFQILFEKSSFQALFTNLTPKDFLDFTDLKSYATRIKDVQKQTGLKDAISVGKGNIAKHECLVACMNFGFIGGSMGSVVGEVIARSIDYCIKKKIPLIIISKSGGARMMESAFSLMQLAKTAAKLTQLSDAKLPFISLLTDPTTGGVSASFAMLGDLNIAEPNALIGFAGPRVIKETIKKDLPEGFQRSEFLLEHGFLDFIVHRHHIKEKIGEILTLFKH